MADDQSTAYAALQQDTLKPAGVTLRQVRLEDADFIAREGGRAEVARMCALIPSPQPLLAAEGFILIMRAREQISGDVLRLVQSGDGERLGLAGLHPRGDGAYEFGYWFAPRAWGKGLATHAGRLMLEEAKARGIETVLAGHYEDNPASGRVLEKLGFAYTGERIDAFSLGRLASAPCLRMALSREAEL